MEVPQLFEDTHRLVFDMVERGEVQGLRIDHIDGLFDPGLVPEDAVGMRGLADRVEACMIKAIREGQEVSSWTNPNAQYEGALQRFVGGVLDGSRGNPFLANFHTFVTLLARPGAIASLAQLVVKLTAPGVPDIYQGGELWDFSLVDPDNRRPVDWTLRRAMLRKVGAVDYVERGDDWGDAELTLPGHPRWRDVLTGREWAGCERMPVSDLLADFPVAV